MQDRDIFKNFEKIGKTLFRIGRCIESIAFWSNGRAQSVL